MAATSHPLATLAALDVLQSLASGDHGVVTTRASEILRKSGIVSHEEPRTDA